MKHEMKLDEKYFYLIKNGIKTYELRLFDEKRQQIKIGDTILFRNVNDLQESFLVNVKSLSKFKTFLDAIKVLDKAKMGFIGQSNEQVLKVYRKFYSENEEDQFGVLVIEVETK